MNSGDEQSKLCGAEAWERSGLADKIGPALLLLGRLVGRLLERALDEEGLGITPAQARVLVTLHFHGPLAQQALALQTDVDPSTLVSTLDVLEREGMAVREPNPDDRRAHLVRLTPHGEQRVPRLFELWDAVEEDLIRDMSASERKALTRMVQDLLGRLHAGDSPCG